MNTDHLLVEAIRDSWPKLFDTSVPEENIQVQKTRKDFKGDKTIVIFPLVKYSRKSPEETAGLLGRYLQENIAEITIAEKLVPPGHEFLLKVLKSLLFVRSGMSAVFPDLKAEF